MVTAPPPRAARRRSEASAVGDRRGSARGSAPRRRREDLGDGAALGVSTSARRSRRTARPAGRPAAVRSSTCPSRAGRSGRRGDSSRRPPRGQAAVGQPGEVALRRCGAVSVTESPPNFSSAPRPAPAPPWPRPRRRRPAPHTRPSAGCAPAGSPVRRVDGAQRARDGRDRLHRRADAQHLARGHAALGAAGAAGDRGGSRRPRRDDLVVRLRAAAAGPARSRRRPRRP